MDVKHSTLPPRACCTVFFVGNLSLKWIRLRVRKRNTSLGPRVGKKFLPNIGDLFLGMMNMVNLFLKGWNGDLQTGNIYTPVIKNIAGWKIHPE